MGRTEVRVLGRAAALVAAVGLLVPTGGCTRIDTALANVPFFSSMKSSPSFDPYEMTRAAPANSVPFESPAGPDEPPRFSNTVPGLDSLAAYVTPPATITPAELERGAALFHRNCMPCHGPEGKGDGPILNKAGETGKFPLAPNLTLPITVDRSDGYIYGIIRQGRGLMPPYGDRLLGKDRWYVVAYVRELQRAAAAGGTPSLELPLKPGDNGWAPPARGMVGLPDNAMQTYGPVFGAGTTGGQGNPPTSAPSAAPDTGGGAGTQPTGGASPDSAGRS